MTFLISHFLSIFLGNNLKNELDISFVYYPFHKLQSREKTWTYTGVIFLNHAPTWTDAENI